MVKKGGSVMWSRRTAEVMDKRSRDLGPKDIHKMTKTPVLVHLVQGALDLLLCSSSCLPVYPTTAWPHEDEDGASFCPSALLCQKVTARWLIGAQLMEELGNSSVCRSPRPTNPPIILRLRLFFTLSKRNLQLLDSPEDRPTDPLSTRDLICTPSSTLSAFLPLVILKAQRQMHVSALPKEITPKI
ncbi:hypothetical protein EYF80_027662 [Liparis tanakae]|uniref:Uncharacterized protein n=1 Tax=Liparis tanakae TaxID=230148 RepID=A0A4Z2H8Y7_9TELE|nr:hypothetical protein EYF80_027662 [Liparis tanakae]